MVGRLLAALRFSADVSCSVQTAETTSYVLHPDEAALLHPRAVEKRREDFRLGRAAAHVALAGLLGAKSGPLLAGERGAPCWPAGVVGAITHSGGVAAAVVSETRRTAGLGVDLEAPVGPSRRHLASRVCRPAERQWIEADAAQADERFRIVFSAKESVYKALSSLCGEPLDFNDVELTPLPGGSALRARTARALGPYPAGFAFDVGRRVVEGYVLTFVALPPNV